MYSRKNQDFAKSIQEENILRSMGLLDSDDDGDDDLAELERDVDADQRGAGDAEIRIGGQNDDGADGVAGVAGVAAAGAVEGVKRTRPKLTPALVIERMDALMGPSFRALAAIDRPSEWVARLMKLLEGWADSVFPRLPFDVFLKRLEAMSGQAQIKNALFELMRKNRRREEEEGDADAALQGGGADELELLFDQVLEAPPQSQQQDEKQQSQLAEENARNAEDGADDGNDAAQKRPRLSATAADSAEDELVILFDD